MDLQDYTVRQDCPECGGVELGADAFEGASYTREGRLTTRFTCPKCGMHLVAVYEVGSDVATVMTGAAFEAIGERAESVCAPSAPEPVDGRAQTYNPRAVPESAAGDAQPEAGAGDGRVGAGVGQAGEPAGHEDGAPDRPAPAEEAAPAAPAKDEKAPGLTINYLPMSSNRLMTFDIRFNTAPSNHSQPVQEDASPVEYSPSDEDKARLEYFHRQLAELDTVDEAIDEIDSGYNLSDGSDNNDDPSR